MFGRDAADDSRPVITAAAQVSGSHRGISLALPETAVVFFMSRGMEIAQERPAHLVTERFPRFLHSACPVGQFDVGNHACFLHGGSGAPMAADTLETLAACGVRRVVALGMCGVFCRDLSVGDVLLPPEALIEEGTSLHYAAGIQRSCPSPALWTQAAAAFPDAKPRTLVSTDAVYRQTFRKEADWRTAGFAGVDMETSAVFTVGSYLGLETVALLIASDKHPEHEGEPTWAWGLSRSQREDFLRRGIEFALTL